jgi:bifunctional UDP-N-acetylglucosamine pyrophosphorylase/glucosamine-1-phosphate N-acetyltransferase
MADTSSHPPIEAIILAAGQGTRLKSQTPKVLHKLFGRSLIERVLRNIEGLGIRQVHLVIGHGREQVQAEVQQLDLSYAIFPVVQEPQMGTGHAVMQVKEAMSTPYDGAMLIATGDAPLLTPETFSRLIASHRQTGNAITLLVANLDVPTGYGRVVMDGDRLVKVVEEKDTTFEEKLITTVNTGVYCIDWPKVSPLLDKLSANNAQKEFYLTDIIALAVEAGMPVGTARLLDAQEMIGVNSRADLALCYHLLNQKTQERLMMQGVTLVDPVSTVVGPEVQAGADTVLYPGCTLEGEITIGSRCIIGPHTTLMGRVQVGDDSSVMHSVVRDSEIGAQTSVGPFAHLRDGAVLSHHVRVGNFVEVKNTRIDHHSNAAHLAYLGDAVLGSEVNMGAGSITANYDPVRQQKHQTVIEDGVKVGCNSVLVAPVRIGENSCVAAGSVITQDVDPWDLAIARPKQTHLPQWVAKIKEKTPSKAP